MDWTDVTEILSLQVMPLMNDPDHGRNWLASLRACPDGERLGLCMAIDICSKAVQPKTFATILDLVDLSLDPREAFGRLVNHPPDCDQYICSSLFSRMPMDRGDTYIRVMELGDFAKFHVRRGYTRAPTHVNRVRSMYFQPRDGVALGDLRTWVRGRLPNAWVTSFSSLSYLLKFAASDERGTLVYDSLGLVIKYGVGGSNKPELIGVRYPPEFEKAMTCTQPTALDAWWVDPGACFLSVGNVDSWGKTYNLSSKGTSLKERVHSLFKNLTPGYSTYYIGIAKRTRRNMKDLLAKGYSRLDAVVNLDP